MAPDEKPGEEEQNDVLSNLPRSRRQRPSARREEAKAARRTAAAGKPADTASVNGGGAGAAKPKPKPKPKTKPKVATTEKVADSGPAERPRRRVPASGYATVRQPGSYGNADPDELLKSFVRSILRRLPG